LNNIIERRSPNVGSGPDERAFSPISENIPDQDGQGNNRQEGGKRDNLLLLQLLRVGELSGIEESVSSNGNILWGRNYIEDSPGFPETEDVVCNPHLHNVVGKNV